MRNQKIDEFKKFMSILWVESKYNGPFATYEGFCASREYLEFHALATLLYNRVRTCKRLAIRALNEGLSENQKRQDERNDEGMRELASNLGVLLEIQGDPRGHTVKLKTPRSKLTNTMGGLDAGWGLPGS